MTFLTRAAAFCFAFALIAACTPADQRPVTQLGDFALGYNIVIAKNAKPVGPSRQATPEEWEAAIKKEVADRFDRQTGEKLYHIGIGVDAYALAVPGIPIVLSPKSVLAITVNVWDDTAGRRVNAEPRQFTVFEKASGDTFIGSGLTSSKEEQMQRLASNAALKIEEWLAQNKAWFSPEAAAARALLPREDQGGAETAETAAATTN
ncbi:hypothetical protein [Albidovulum sp.]|uniref:hypothetical protein n=1 Tax=Albidovulum sp. TaxID=1872424 RepID=UPI001DE811D1|nr:hypothetical protein [Paracoccaceae bacterium]MCC0046008.1 hypothetical protein [Defluviimonas sp.]HPE23908.1 hypothetical protein [Albidovulum sp.]MCP5354474.1 hypothetical protein [Paracoccaceae bacterium]MCP5375790.1 hypothetical protein [Paracoccaceae bacterium]